MDARRRKARARRRLAIYGVLNCFIVVAIMACGGAAATSTAPPPTATTAPAALATNTTAPPTATQGSSPTAATAASPTTAATATSRPASPVASQPGALLACSAASNFRQLQPPTPATPGTPAATATRPASPSSAPPPTATPRPAPRVDRVGFPENYQSTFKLLFVFDRPDNKQVRVICGNDLAASVKPGQPFPYGSILVMETYRTKQDAAGNPVLDANGNYIREALAGIFVQRKEPGFGADYGADRSGEWEYVGFRPDKSYSNPPAATNACATCHLNQAGPGVDFAFRMALFFDPASAAPARLSASEVNIATYAFSPATQTVAPGTTVTWFNNDEAEHSINAVNKAFDSPILKTKLVKPGEKFSYTFTQPGTYEYFCAIHPAMKAKIEVR